MRRNFFYAKTLENVARGVFIYFLRKYFFRESKRKKAGMKIHIHLYIKFMFLCCLVFFFPPLFL